MRKDKLKELEKREQKLLKELKKIEKEKERERQRLLRIKDEAKKKRQRRNFIKELKEGGIPVTQIARKAGISYYKARKIKNNPALLKSKTPEYRKITNLHRRTGYQKLRELGATPAQAKKLRRDMLKTEPIFKERKGKETGWVLKAFTSSRIKETRQKVIDFTQSKKIAQLNEEKLREDIRRQLRAKYGSIDVDFIREEFIKTIKK